MSEQAFQGTRNTGKRETITERFEQFNESNHSLITLIGMSNLTHQIRFDCVNSVCSMCISFKLRDHINLRQELTPFKGRGCLD